MESPLLASTLGWSDPTESLSLLRMPAKIEEQKVGQRGGGVGGGREEGQW